MSRAPVPCEACGWLLDVEGLCTNPACELGGPSETPEGRDPAEPSAESKEAVRKAGAAPPTLEQYNRARRRGNPIGRHAKRRPAPIPVDVLPDAETIEHRMAREQAGRELEKRTWARAQAKRKARRAARKKGRR